MPKRVLDFDALWASDKLAACADWAQSEYAWLYGLADASGSFEITNLRVIWGRVAAIRKNLSLERLQEIFDEFIARGLLFTWEENGKRYGHWTGSDVPGRLPSPSWRARLEKLAPPVPPEALAAYSARFGGSKEGIVARAGARSAAASEFAADPNTDAQAQGLKHHLEEAQAQDWSLVLDSEKDLEKEKAVCPASPPDLLLQIYEDVRGELPTAGAMTLERRKRCERWLAAGNALADFRAAVQRAAATPFLAGDSTRGWQANFDWLIANRSNVRKVLAGEYDAYTRSRARGSRAEAERRGPADLYAGAGPQPADYGVRVNPAALERIRARAAKASSTSYIAEPAANPIPCLEPRAVGLDAQSRASPASLKL